ncbi:hypothetical protein [Streptomyces hygroscopicus]|uniref:hypothetical protein n=1 Tax=Streptomyces hygroscopicus TaxID=1912 RepID=UPI001F3EDCAD|nr:hypothetical protein [Streptomyces hygroscopicus]
MTPVVARSPCDARVVGPWCDAGEARRLLQSVRATSTLVMSAEPRRSRASAVE